MNIESVQNTLNARLLVGKKLLNEEVEHVYASDLMSDVLSFGKPRSILVTGLATRQAIITAHMAEFKGLVLIRGKKPNEGVEKFAREHDLALLTTRLDMYETCVNLDTIQRKQSSTQTETHTRKADDILLRKEFFIEGGDYTSAGMVSTEVKSTLKQIGFSPLIIRRIAISTFESEMNVVMHAKHGKVTLIVNPDAIEVILEDVGQGIPDIDLAMQEGYTTSTEEMRAMGFGSGMGLPNIKRNTDELDIQSEVGKGTKVHMKFFTQSH
ncbi:MAG: hypothetical protein JEZ06_04215 [Anaerolineaceae bacterium]|nr:hypothetical protein [Anaerolineaceae bacterium]